MARFRNLTINSKFQPFNYELLVAPLKDATVAHNELADAYTEMETKAGVWENLANKEADPITYALYEKYINDLQKAADYLAEYGLDPTSRRTLSKMNTRYSKEIVPIERAYNTREKHSLAQKDAKAKDPSLFFDRDAASTSLDEYLRNPALDYDQESGTSLMAQMSAMTLTLADDLMSPGDNDTKRLLVQVLPYQYLLSIQRGFTREELNAFMQNPETQPILYNMARSVLQSSRAYKWTDAQGNPNLDALNTAWEWIKRGAWSAEGTTTQEKWTDEYGMRSQLQRESAELDFQKQLALARAKLREEEDKALLKLYHEIANNSFSFLQSSGKEAKILEHLNGLLDENGRLKSEYGDENSLNLMEIYEDYKDNAKRIKEAALNSYSKWGYNSLNLLVLKVMELVDAELEILMLYGGLQADPNLAVNMNYYRKELMDLMMEGHILDKLSLEEAKDRVLIRHNVQSIIDDDTYETLKAIKYNEYMSEDSKRSFKDVIQSGINSLAQEKSMYSTAMASYDKPDEWIHKNLGLKDKSGGFSGIVYKLTVDGKLGEPVKNIKDLNLNERKVVDIYYNPETPKKIVVTLGKSSESGTITDVDNYVMDPSVLGEEFRRMIQEESSKLDPTLNNTKAAIAITARLSNMLNNYNPVASSTSSNV